MKKFYLSLIIIFFCIGTISCSTTSKKEKQLFAKQSEEKIFLDGKKAFNKHKYEEAIKHFETINSRYPFGKYAEVSSLDLIKAYYKHDEIALALATADRYIRIYPRGDHVDYAYYMKGLIQLNENRGFFEKYFPMDPAKRDLKSFDKAYSDFDQLVHYFPKSKYAPKAQKKMIYIKNTLANYELHIARFYYKHEAYVAAINRANNIVENYQKTNAVHKALKIMNKSYRKLGLNKESEDVNKILKLNFGKLNKKK